MTIQTERPLTELTDEELADGIAKLGDMRDALLEDFPPGLTEQEVRAIFKIKEVTYRTLVEWSAESSRRAKIAQQEI